MVPTIKPYMFFHEKMGNHKSCFDKADVVLDDIDNPHNLKPTLSSTEKDQTIEPMKHEANRLNSFAGKWPLRYIEPKSLSECGFFYLQSEDKVQCAFCSLILNQWNIGDTPLHEHIKKNPRCPFLLSKDVGNIPVSMPARNPSRPIRKSDFPEELKQVKNLLHLGRPKNQRMADLRSRLVTFNAWPLVMLSPQTLSECGLYYTGVSDVVTCFFCGGSLGNWELDDDPWTEHRNFFPQCPYLDLAAKYGKGAAKKPAIASSASQSASAGASSYSAANPRDALSAEIIRQASDIFAPELVQQVVMRRRRNGQENFTSLSELCEEILELGAGAKATDEVTSYKKHDASVHEPQKLLNDMSITSACIGKVPAIAQSTEDVPSGSSTTRDLFLCKICMDSERAVVFQPCGHLVSCQKCSLKIFDCPVCRTPITGKVRTYLS